MAKEWCHGGLFCFTYQILVVVPVMCQFSNHSLHFHHRKGSSKLEKNQFHFSPKSLLAWNHEMVHRNVLVRNVKYDKLCKREK